MRLLLPVAVFIVATTTASAQTSAPVNPFGLDPYKPSDAALLREFGLSLKTQTPVHELAKLDPYKPSHAAVLRLGGALPVWAIGWPTAMVVFDPRPQPVAATEVVKEDRHHRGMARGDRPEVAPPAATSIATLRRPESNDGIWVDFDGRRWILAGRTMPLEPSHFERAGEINGHAVYRRPGQTDVIYVDGGDTGVAPFRLKE
jgi:hypothetical protein